MSNLIILYDIPTAEGFTPKAWSPNTWKTRFVLNYKGIPYKTEWVEYPDIEPLCKKLGAPPTEKKPDGRDHYTLPMIYDPSTKTVVVDSYVIAKYLETTYPDTPRIFPSGLNAFQAAFCDHFWTTYSFPLFMIIISRVAGALSPRSAEYFRSTREQKFSSKLEALNTPDEWKKLESAWTKLQSFYLENGKGKETLLTGEKVTYSDIQIASVLVWARNICGVGSEDWKRIAGFGDGFWDKYLKQFEAYEAIDS